MTNDTDEFDQDQFDPMDTTSDDGLSYEDEQSFLDKWRNSPIVKLVIIMLVIGLALAGALGVFSDDSNVEISKIARAPSLSEAPGGRVSKFFIEQNDMENNNRAREALQTGESAFPTPRGNDISDLAPPPPDPMLEFKAETERIRKELREEQAQNARKVEMLQKQVQQSVNTPEDNSLAQAMQKQMEQLMESWVPKGAKIVVGTAKPTENVQPQVTNVQNANFVNNTNNQVQAETKSLVAAGTVNYMQLLIEANSDIPGPILAQILSGPFTGGRAIGAFQVVNDYIVMTFSSISYKGKEYSVQALALDPNTTLGGMATEVDHRYFTRILLPAAGAFVSTFGNALAETDSKTTVNNGSVVQDQVAKGMKEALYDGIGSIGETVSEFFKSEANKTKTLVRVAVGTPMGLFFLSSVIENGNQFGNKEAFSNKEDLAKGYKDVLKIEDTKPQPVYQKKNSKEDNPFSNLRAPNF